MRGTAASRVFFRIVAKAVRMGEYWPDISLQEIFAVKYKSALAAIVNGQGAMLPYEIKNSNLYYDGGA